MLKIKADKMCELKKFGFEKRLYFEYSIEIGPYSGRLYIDLTGNIEINGNICHEIGDKLLAKIHDLIKADMVEVEE